MLEIKLSQLARSIGLKLKSLGQSVSVAESCTGGGVAYYLTSVSGSSAWFDAGFVTYSNEAKVKMLGVNPDVLVAKGAVSAEVVVQMAEGAALNADADCAIAISGVAGPAGGSEEKPVGTVYIAWHFKNANKQANTDAQLFQFKGDRDAVRDKSIEYALQGLLDRLV